MARFAHKKLPVLRQQAGLSQTRLALILRDRGYGTNQVTISHWETDREPRAYILPALAAALNVTVNDLYDEAADAPFPDDGGRRAA